MTKLADAEKLNGNTHWTLYNGKGGVYRARRYAHGWEAHGHNVSGFVMGRTLREVRAKLMLITD